MTGHDDQGALRRAAEQRLEERRTGATPHGPRDPARLVHELEVHQIELEMQNEELRASRHAVEAGLRRYTALFDFAPIGYFVVDAEGTIHELNFAGARLLGGDRRALAGRKLRTYVDPEEHARFADYLSRLVTQEPEDRNGASPPLVELRIGERDVRLSGALLDEGIPSALIAAEDVTDRKRAEARLREEARNKDAFLAMLSHELRNPLTPIRNSLYVLSKASPEGEEASRAHEVIDRQVNHLTRIVDDLLDVTRIARGKVQLRREKLELGDLVRRTMDDHRRGFQVAGITFEGRFGPDRFWVEADPTRIAQSLGNLLSNAAKFTSRGDRIEVALWREGRTAVLSVRDTGLGFAPETGPSLFQPFVQGPQALDRVHGGLGLGLAMVRGLVEMHGGTAEARSRGPGQGAEFVLRLPLAPGTPAPEPAIPRPEPRVAPGRRVLVIEDNLDSAESLRDALHLGGHDVRIATGGRDGLELARRFRPEVAVCDIGMPGMDGYAVARAFRADDELKDVFLVALTGYALPEDLVRAADAGFDRHVVKPPLLEDLEQMMANVPPPAAEPRVSPAG